MADMEWFINLQPNGMITFEEALTDPLIFNPEDTGGIIYFIIHEQEGPCYIGQTGRTLKERMAGHASTGSPITPLVRSKGREGLYVIFWFVPYSEIDFAEYCAIQLFTPVFNVQYNWRGWEERGEYFSSKFLFEWYARRGIWLDSKGQKTRIESMDRRRLSSIVMWIYKKIYTQLENERYLEIAQEIRTEALGLIPENQRGILTVDPDAIRSAVRERLDAEGLDTEVIYSLMSEHPAWPCLKRAIDKQGLWGEIGMPFLNASRK